ncbi:hypothetical protein ACLKMY_41110, partial [Paraburkholderia mimosarum]|uniref:hypothetical protein n=1 Tax=Paraburkholderia mimosarum TaxID=312026 RepID=UPI0039C23331
LPGGHNFERLALDVFDLNGTASILARAERAVDWLHHSEGDSKTKPRGTHHRYFVPALQQ